MNLYMKDTTYQTWMRIKMAVMALIGTWRHTRGIEFVIGDTVNIHHKFYIRRK